MGKRANIRATAINTAAIAETNAQLAHQARRDQLTAQGLIEFNVSDGVVRAVERRLTEERGEPVPPIGDPGFPYLVGAIAAVIALIGLLLAFAEVKAGGPMLILGGLVAALAISNGNRIARLLSDEAELEAFEANRARRRQAMIGAAAPPATIPPARSAPVTPGIAPTPPPRSSSPHPTAARRRHSDRGLRRPVADR